MKISKIVQTNDRQVNVSKKKKKGTTKNKTKTKDNVSIKYQDQFPQQQFPAEVFYPQQYMMHHYEQQAQMMPNHIGYLMPHQMLTQHRSVASTNLSAEQDVQMLINAPIPQLPPRNQAQQIIASEILNTQLPLLPSASHEYMNMQRPPQPMIGNFNRKVKKPAQPLKPIESPAVNIKYQSPTPQERLQISRQNSERKQKESTDKKVIHQETPDEIEIIPQKRKSGKQKRALFKSNSTNLCIGKPMQIEQILEEKHSSQQSKNQHSEDINYFQTNNQFSPPHPDQEQIPTNSIAHKKSIKQVSSGETMQQNSPRFNQQELDNVSIMSMSVAQPVDITTQRNVGITVTSYTPRTSTGIVSIKETPLSEINPIKPFDTNNDTLNSAQNKIIEENKQDLENNHNRNVEFLSMPIQKPKNTFKDNNNNVVNKSSKGSNSSSSYVSSENAKKAAIYEEKNYTDQDSFAIEQISRANQDLKNELSENENQVGSHETFGDEPKNKMKLNLGDDHFIPDSEPIQQIENLTDVIIQKMKEIEHQNQYDEVLTEDHQNLQQFKGIKKLNEIDLIFKQFENEKQQEFTYQKFDGSEEVHQSNVKQILQNNQQFIINNTQVLQQNAKEYLKNYKKKEQDMYEKENIIFEQKDLELNKKEDSDTFLQNWQKFDDQQLLCNKIILSEEKFEFENKYNYKEAQRKRERRQTIKFNMKEQLQLINSEEFTKQNTQLMPTTPKIIGNFDDEQISAETDNRYQYQQLLQIDEYDDDQEYSNCSSVSFDGHDHDNMSPCSQDEQVVQIEKNKLQIMTFENIQSFEQMLIKHIKISGMKQIIPNIISQHLFMDVNILETESDVNIEYLTQNRIHFVEVTDKAKNLMQYVKQNRFRAMLKKQNSENKKRNQVDLSRIFEQPVTTKVGVQICGKMLFNLSQSLVKVEVENFLKHFNLSQQNVLNVSDLSNELQSGSLQIHNMMNESLLKSFNNRNQKTMKNFNQFEYQQRLSSVNSSQLHLHIKDKLINILLINIFIQNPRIFGQIQNGLFYVVQLKLHRLNDEMKQLVKNDLFQTYQNYKKTILNKLDNVKKDKIVCNYNKDENQLIYNFKYNYNKSLLKQQEKNIMMKKQTIRQYIQSKVFGDNQKLMIKYQNPIYSHQLKVKMLNIVYRCLLQNKVENTQNIIIEMKKAMTLEERAYDLNQDNLLSNNTFKNVEINGEDKMLTLPEYRIEVINYKLTDYHVDIEEDLKKGERSDLLRFNLTSVQGYQQQLNYDFYFQYRPWLLNSTSQTVLDNRVDKRKSKWADTVSLFEVKRRISDVIDKSKPIVNLEQKLKKIRRGKNSKSFEMIELVPQLLFNKKPLCNRIQYVLRQSFSISNHGLGQAQITRQADIRYMEAGFHQLCKIEQEQESASASSKSLKEIGSVETDKQFTFERERENNTEISPDQQKRYQTEFQLEIIEECQGKLECDSLIKPTIKLSTKNHRKISKNILTSMINSSIFAKRRLVERAGSQKTLKLKQQKASSTMNSDISFSQKHELGTKLLENSIVKIHSDADIKVRPTLFNNLELHSNYAIMQKQQQFQILLDNVECTIQETLLEIKSEEFQPMNIKFTQELQEVHDKFYHYKILDIQNVRKDTPNIFSPIIQDIDISDGRIVDNNNIIAANTVSMTGNNKESTLNFNTYYEQYVCNKSSNCESTETIRKSNSFNDVSFKITSQLQQKNISQNKIKKILLQKIKENKEKSKTNKEKRVKFQEDADRIKLYAQNDKVILKLKNLKKFFVRTYDNPELRGGPRFTYIINKVKQRLNYINSIDQFNEIIRKQNRSACRQQLQGQYLDMDLLKLNIQNDQTTIVMDSIKINSSQIDQQDSDGFSLLAYASYNGKVEAVEALITYGANVNIKTKERQNTPLHIAVEQGFKMIQDALIEGGSDENIKNIDGKTAWQMCRLPI